MSTEGTIVQGDEVTPAEVKPRAAEAGKAGGLARGLGAGGLTCLLLSLLGGAVDAAYAVTHASEVDAGFGGWLAASFYSAGLLTPLTVPLGVGAGLVLGAAPWDLGPLGLWAGLRKLATARGAEAASLASAGWAGLGALLVGFYGLFKLNYIFITAFHHATLAALTLAVVVLIWGAVIGGGALLAARGLRALFTPMAERGSLVSSPLGPLAVVALGVVAVAVMVPTRYGETWDALDMRAPVGALLMVVGAWAGAGLLASRLTSLTRTAAMGAAVGGVAVALAGLLVPTLSLFGASPEDAPLVYAVRERGLLARVPMGILQQRFDTDGDGYASKLGGGDCDDSDPAIFPGADEIIANGRDEDCDGQDLTPPPAQDPAQVAEVDAQRPDKEEPGAAPAADPLAQVRRPRNVVLIMVDTLRWDVLGYAGYERPTSPNLDKLAARSVVFDNAYSVSSKTPTAIPPVLASRWPSEMPRTYNHFVLYEEENLFLAEVLRDAGFHTATSACHWYFQRKYGFDQGFQRWESYMIDGDEMERIPTSKQVSDTAIRMARSLYAGGLPSDPQDGEVAPKAGADKPPFFLFVHYLDPHKHYIDHEGFEPFGNGPRARYDGEVRFTDHHLGRLLDTLEEQDPGLQNTMILFTSDHGEAFGEHDHRFHGRDLYEHQIRVPLMIYMPGAEHRRVKERVSLIDLAPTITDALGLKTPPSFRGASLLSTLALGKAPSPQRVIYTEMPPGPYNGVFRSLTVGDWKLIHRLHGNYYRLFNVATDPGELDDQFKANPKKGEELKQALQLFRAQHVNTIEAVKR